MRQTLVRARKSSVVTLDGVVSDDLKSLANNEVDWLSLLQDSSADFRTLGVKHQGDGLVGSLLESGLQVVYRCLVRFVVTVRKVKTCNIHACVNHFNEHVDIPAGWPESADDFGATFGDIDGLKDVGELDPRGVL